MVKARRTALMATELESKRKSLSGFPGRSVAFPGTVRFTLVPLDGHSAAPGWFFRRPPSVGPERPKRCQTALRGRPVANSRTTDCHSAGERRPRNLSVPPDLGRRVECGMRSGDSQPVLIPHSELARLGRRAASVVAGVSQRCVVSRVRRGGQSKATGSGTPPQRGRMESSSKWTSLANAVALVAPVRQAAPPPAGVSHGSHLFFPRQFMVFLRSDSGLSLTTPGTSRHRMPPASATGGRPPP